MVGHSGGMIVISGSLPVKIHVQVTAPPVEGVGWQVSHGIVISVQLHIGSQVMVTFQLVGFGVAVQ